MKSKCILNIHDFFEVEFKRRNYIKYRLFEWLCKFCSKIKLRIPCGYFLSAMFKVFFFFDVEKVGRKQLKEKQSVNLLIM